MTDPAIYQDKKNTVDQKGLYLQNHTRFDSGITVTAGLRKSWVETETVDRLGGTTTTQEDDALTGSIGATWDLGNGFIPYAGYTEGFETNIGTDFFGAMFRPSDSEQFELGLRYLPGAGDLLLSAALFDLTKTNVLTTDTDNPGFQVQTGEVRHKGLELEARGRLGSNLSAIFSYSYIDAEITRSNDGDQGNRTAKVPEHQASLWLDYAFDGGLSGWSMGGGLRYVGESWGDNGNTRRVDDYVVADLSLRYAWENYQASLGVTNLFDDGYFATCEAGGGCTRGEGREITFTLSRAF